MATGLLPHDPTKMRRAPSLAGHAFAAEEPPETLLRPGLIDWTPNLDQNDLLPICTVAGIDNAACCVAVVNGFLPKFDRTVLVPFYAAVVGCAPTAEAVMATEGAQALDVLSRQAMLGLPVWSPAPLVGLFGTLPRSRAVIANATNRLAHAYLGVQLLERDMEGGSAAWTFVPGRDDGKVVARHIIVSFRYTGLGDEDAVEFATWGRWQYGTWAWLNARLTEQHALIWRQLGNADGQNLGVAEDVLEASLHAYVTSDA